MGQNDMVIKDKVLISYNGGESLVVPEGVIAISNRCVFRVTLKSLSLPASFTTVKSEHFRIPPALNITVAAGNPKLKAVNNCIIDKATDTLVFACSGGVNIPSVKHIGAWAFAGNKYFKIDIPASVKTIGERAFSGCKITDLVLHDGLIGIGDYAFENCMLRGLTLPKTLQSIGNNAFLNGCRCDELVIPDSVKTIGEYAFRDCVIKYITMGKGVTAMGGNTFYGCRIPRNFYASDSEPVHPHIKIPEGVTKILPRAYCSSHCIFFRLPSTITEIGDNAFGLHWVVWFNGTKRQWEAIKKGKGFEKGVDVRCSDGRIAIPSYVL